MGFFGVYPYFDIIITNAENSVSHKYIVQNSKSNFGVILGIIGSSVLIPGQNLLDDFFLNETQISILNKFLKIKHSNKSTFQRQT